MKKCGSPLGSTLNFFCNVVRLLSHLSSAQLQWISVGNNDMVVIKAEIIDWLLLLLYIRNPLNGKLNIGHLIEVKLYDPILDLYKGSYVISPLL